MKYIKVIAKPNGYYKEGTEVFNYNGNRFTLEEWDDWGDYLVVTGEVISGEEDGEYSNKSDFDVIILD